ncbi:MAG: hypothetical protein R3B13_26980 [Polyangiaceae bacterium]
MSFQIEREPPSSPAALVDALYAGRVFLLPACAASRELCDAVQGLLIESLGSEPRRAYDGGSAEHFQRLGALRRRLYMESAYHDLLFRIVAQFGLRPEECAFDPLRLRVVQSAGHENVRAAPVYTPHRDTWYSHPQALLTWWIPLDDLPEEQTFVFYPECFRRPVANDSEGFVYERWVEKGWDLKIGWQNREAGRRAHYPGALGPVQTGPAVGFSCRRGENLIFAGAHFHETRRQVSGLTRFSVDFRLADLADVAAGRGAPNVDARCRGSAADDYVRGRRVTT